MAFMPFMTAGDPDMATTVALIRELASRGVDLIEVGFPYSDPIADGPVIQASYTRALERNFTVAELFAGISSLKHSETPIPPLVAMVSFAIVYRTGVEKFLDRAQAAGFSGLIVPDLPGDEAAELAEAMQTRSLDLVQLIAPTTPPDRAERILESCSGFLYCISVAGTTGVRSDLPTELRDQLAWLRTTTDLPLAVGFGISKPEHVDMLRDTADGVIVGSAIVRQLEDISDDGNDAQAALQSIGDFATSMVTAVRG
jgi:tryptophan synthase alpha chain